jgi:hypothetical protein
MNAMGVTCPVRVVVHPGRNRNNEQGQTDQLHNELHAYVERAQKTLHLFLSATNNPEQDKIEFDHVLLLPWRAKARALS